MPPDWRPAIRRDQLLTAERRPAEEGLKHPCHRTAQREKGLNTPTRWTGPGKKDLNTPTTGPRCLRRACVKSAAAAFPLGDLREQRIIPTVNPGNRDRAPKISMAETLAKPNNGSIVAQSRPVA